MEKIPEEGYCASTFIEQLINQARLAKLGEASETALVLHCYLRKSRENEKTKKIRSLIIRALRDNPNLESAEPLLSDIKSVESDMISIRKDPKKKHKVRMVNKKPVQKGCFICHEEGHMARECKRRCRTCGNIGHHERR